METLLKKVILDIPNWRVLNILFEKDRSSFAKISEHAITKLPTSKIV